MTLKKKFIPINPKYRKQVNNRHILRRRDSIIELLPSECLHYLLQLTRMILIGHTT